MIRCTLGNNDEMTDPVIVTDVSSLALRTSEQPTYDRPDGPFDVDVMESPHD